MNKLVEILARDFREYRIINGFDAGIPLYFVRLFVEMLEKQDLTSFESYMLHSIELGAKTHSEIAYLLGVEDRDLIAPGAGLLKQEYITQGGIITAHGRLLQLTSKGRQALSEQGPPPVPIRRTCQFHFNALTWTPILQESDTHTADQMGKKGFAILPKARKEKLTLGDFTEEDVNLVIEKDPESKVIALLEQKKVEPIYRAPVQVIQLKHKKTEEPGIAVYFNSRLQQPETITLQRMLENGEFTFPSEVYTLQETKIEIPIPLPTTVSYATQALAENAAIINDIDLQIVEHEEQKGSTNSPEERHHLESRIAQLKEELRIKREDNEFLIQTLQQSQIKFLTTIEHRPLLLKALREAHSEITIISPWMNRRACNDEFCRLVADALKRGVAIHIGYGMGNERDPQEAARNRNNLMDVRGALHRFIPQHLSESLKIKETSGTHQKILICDDVFAVTGSFNWLSYLGQKDEGYREETGTLHRHIDQVKAIAKIAREVLTS